MDQQQTLPEEISFTKIPDAAGKGFQDDKIDAAASPGSEVVPTEPDSDVEVVDSAAATEAPSAAVEEVKPQVQSSEELQVAAAELEEEAKETDDKNLRRLQLASRTEAKEAQQAAKEAKEEEKKKRKAEAKPKGRPRKNPEDSVAQPRKPRSRKGGKAAGKGEEAEAPAVKEAEAPAGQSQDAAASARKRPAAAGHSDRRKTRRTLQPVTWEYPLSVKPELVAKFVKLMEEWDNVKYDKAEMTLHTQSLVSTYEISCVGEIN